MKRFGFGNYGVADGDAESGTPRVAGFIVRESSPRASNWRADGTLRDIVVMQPQDDGGAATFYADTARLIYEDGTPILEMRKGIFVPEKAEQKAAFETLRKPVPVPDVSKKDRNREQMSLTELIAAEREYAQTPITQGRK